MIKQCFILFSLFLIIEEYIVTKDLPNDIKVNIKHLFECIPEEVTEDNF